MSSESVIREPLITGGKTVHDVTEDISKRVEEKPNKLWMLAMTISLGLLAVGAYTVFLLLWHGVGVWGLNKTVGWALGYHQFCLVGGYWPCGYIDFSHPIVISTTLEDVH